MSLFTIQCCPCTCTCLQERGQRKEQNKVRVERCQRVKGERWQTQTEARRTRENKEWKEMQPDKMKTEMTLKLKEKWSSEVTTLSEEPLWYSACELRRGSAYQLGNTDSSRPPHQSFKTPSVSQEIAHPTDALTHSSPQAHTYSTLIGG